MNRLALSLAVATTEECLTILRKFGDVVALAEICLDAMAPFDLARLGAESPVPLIATCRPVREGGSYTGRERDRLEILEAAALAGFRYVDIEWDALDALREHRLPDSVQVIASRHWFGEIPSDLYPFYEELRDRADVVKLVGTARGVSDVVPMFDLWAKATSQVIAFAMGPEGRLTRLLAVCAEPSLLTYAAAQEDAETAPGQLPVEELTARYHLHEAGPTTPIFLHICASADEREQAVRRNDGEGLHIALPAASDLRPVIGAILRTLPHARVVNRADAAPVEDRRA